MARQLKWIRFLKLISRVAAQRNDQHCLQTDRNPSAISIEEAQRSRSMYGSAGKEPTIQDESVSETHQIGRKSQSCR